MKDKSLSPIGVFDSGLGGLTVLTELLKAIPNEHIIYLGDTARVPYGNKSPQTVTRYSFENTRFLLKKAIKLLIVACNTASAYSIDTIKSEFSVPCLGVIQPGARAAIQKTRFPGVAVIGTSGTIQSRAYPEAIHKLKPDIMVYEKACPLFVPLVENEFINDPVTYEVAKKYLKDLKKKKIDTLILGCTHYPVLKTVIAKVMKDVKLVDSSLAVAKEVEKVLIEKDLCALRNPAKGKLKCFITDDVEGFNKVAKVFFKETISTKKVVL